MAEALHRSVLDVLGAEITSGVHAEGTVLTLERIQHRFGISRTVARECMRLLEQLQFVTSSRRVGIVVLGSHEWDVLDPLVIRWRLAGPGRAAQLRSLAELGAAVEPLAAARAAVHATDAERLELTELAGLLRASREAGEFDDFLDHDIAFHNLLLVASRNEMFAALTTVVTAVLTSRSHSGLASHDGHGPASVSLHEDVARAVRERDAVAAEVSMRELLAVRTLDLARQDGSLS